MSERDPHICLREFAKELIRLEWDGGVHGGDVQDIAERHGLIVPAQYDPAVHGEDFEGEPGTKSSCSRPGSKAPANPVLAR